MTTHSPIASIAAEAAAFARMALVGRVREKAPMDFVTELDLALEARIAAGLEDLAPGEPVFGEETLLAGQRIDGACWLVDPLDGTGNFIAGLPVAAVSIARLDSNGETTEAAVADVARGDVFTASLGAGAWLNGEPFVARDEPAPLMALSSGVVDLLLEMPEAYRELRSLAKLRNFGAQSLHLCHVATGGLSFAASREARLWDDAAGRLIASEAGATYVSFAPRVSANDPFAEQLSVGAGRRVLETVLPLFELLFRQEMERVE